MLGIPLEIHGDLQKPHNCHFNILFERVYHGGKALGGLRNLHANN